MTIEILGEEIIKDIDTGIDLNRSVAISITDNGNTYEWTIGGLPLTGDLQTILDAREAELLTAAQAGNQIFEVYNQKEKRVLKALALVILDEINILRGAVIPPLTPRNAGQIEGAIKNKLKSLL